LFYPDFATLSREHGNCNPVNPEDNRINKIKMIRLYNLYKYFFQLLILVVLTAFGVYFIPPQFNKIIFLLLLIPVWKSKNDYFWFAYLLILLEAPGGLFSGTRLNSPSRLPIYTFAPNVSTSFTELFILLFLVKSFYKNQWYRYKSFVYRKWYGYLGFLLIILLIMSFMLGVSGNHFIPILRGLIVLSLYVSTIFIFKKEEDIIKFFKIIFPFAFIAIILQIYDMVNHQQLVAHFNPLISTTQGVLTGDEMRPIELAVTLLFCFFGSLLFLGKDNSGFSQSYLLAVNITSYVSIFMTGTRSWILGFTIMYLFYFYLNYKRLGKKVIAFVIAIGFFLIIIFITPQIGNQINIASKRLATIQELVAGDLTAGGTLSRITERGPRVMEGFKNSTIIFGAGYSDLYFDYGDTHVGFQNNLLQSGLIGFFILISFAATLFFTPLRNLKKFSYRPDLKTILHNLPLLIPGVLIINSATQFWGFDTNGISRVMLLAAYISISSIYIQAYRNQAYTK
jgi:hypothetical protein